jgi:hypothetical protein
LIDRPVDLGLNLDDQVRHCNATPPFLLLRQVLQRGIPTVTVQYGEVVTGTRNSTVRPSDAPYTVTVTIRVFSISMGSDEGGCGPRNRIICLRFCPCLTPYNPEFNISSLALISISLPWLRWLFCTRVIVPLLPLNSNRQLFRTAPMVISAPPRSYVFKCAQLSGSQANWALISALTPQVCGLTTFVSAALH